ncbi:activating signal cointegrator 1-like [Lytechinus pictus]|uniref:activating signal cointegrator 1-like n=1 Tax=Lytechinus pictus TaxID=7653 RepID=UPI0030BA0317
MQVYCQGRMAVSPSLVTWCTEELNRLLASDVTPEWVSYLLDIQDDQELEEYLCQLLDNSDESSTTFIEELMKRRSSGPALPKNFTVYRKSSTQEDLKKDTSKHKGKSKSKEKRTVLEAVSPSNLKSNTSSQLPLQIQPNQLQQQPTGNGLTHEVDDHALALQQGARRKTKFVSLYSQEGEARTAIHLPGRHPCECQAHKHALVSNCLECGRVVCSQEGSGPCLFCGALVCNKEEQEILARNSKKSDKLRKKLMGETLVNGDAPPQKPSGKNPSSIDRAIAHKDKLIEFDKTSVRRTKVHDDQSDYFSSDTNQWLSTKERTELKKREEDLREKKHGSRLNKNFTLDFAGRKVVEEEVEEMYNSQDEVVQRVIFGNKPRGEEVSRGGHDATILNPSITREAPKFVSNVPTNLHQGSSNQISSREGSSRTNHRVQDKELMEMSDEGQCLSMHQPWASLLVAGIKK